MISDDFHPAPAGTECDVWSPEPITLRTLHALAELEARLICEGGASLRSRVLEVASAHGVRPFGGAKATLRALLRTIHRAARLARDLQEIHP